VLQHYFAKEETQMTEHWCIVHATVQLLQHSRVSRFSLTVPPTARAENIDYKISGVIHQHEYESQIKKIEEIK